MYLVIYIPVTSQNLSGPGEGVLLELFQRLGVFPSPLACATDFLFSLRDLLGLPFALLEAAREVGGVSAVGWCLLPRTGDLVFCPFNRGLYNLN